MSRKDEIIAKAKDKLSYSSIQQSGFIQGAEWADQSMLEKVIKWAKKNARKYAWHDDANDTCGFSVNIFIKDLKKAMEE